MHDVVAAAVLVVAVVVDANIVDMITIYLLCLFAFFAAFFPHVSPTWT